MANRVRPGIEQTRLMSRTPNVRKAEWDLIRGNHQGQWQLRCIKQAGHMTAGPNAFRWIGSQIESTHSKDALTQAGSPDPVAFNRSCIMSLSPYQLDWRLLSAVLYPASNAGCV